MLSFVFIIKLIAQSKIFFSTKIFYQTKERIVKLIPQPFLHFIKIVHAGISKKEDVFLKHTEAIVENTDTKLGTKTYTKRKDV